MRDIHVRVASQFSKMTRSVLAGALMGMLAFGASAHAASSITGYTDTASSFGRIGFGGVYYADSLQGQNLNTLGGFIAISGDEMYKRFKVSLAARFGLGIAGQERMVGNFELLPRFGFNILTQSVPLYVNVIFYYDDRRIVSHGINAAHRSFGIGGELEGKIPLSQSVALEYGAGYVYDPGLTYRFYPSQNLNLLARAGAASSVLAHVGAAFDITDRLHSYVRLSGKYQYLPASPTISHDGMQYFIAAHNVFSAMIEVGLGF